MANAKHWVLNSQEDHRTSISDDAAERVRFEIYYPPFAAAVDAGPRRRGGVDTVAFVTFAFGFGATGASSTFSA